MSSGTEQFSEDVPAYGTNEMVEETFGPSFETDSDATLLLQERRNVLSKAGLLSMLTVQDRIDDRPDLRVRSTTSPASMVARELDPSARTLEDQREAVELSSDTEIQQAVKQAATDPAFRELLGEDYNRESGTASAAVGVIEHEIGDEDEQLSTIQLEARHVANSVDGDVRVFGQGITDYENRQVLQDSLLAARVTLRGTGGALFGTTVTTASAGVVLFTLSITPILVQFGLLIALSVTYSFLASVVVLPVILVVWTRWGNVATPERFQARWPAVGD